MQTERGGRVAGIVLAAGSSSRMGSNKLLFDVQGETLVRRAVRQAGEAGLDPVVVVLGFEADRVRAALADVRCRPVVNAEHAKGVNASLRAGMAALPADTVAVVVILADMPLVTTAMIDTLVQRYRSGTAPLVISDYAGVNAPPMLYHRVLFGELAVPAGEGCGRQVVRAHQHEAETVTWPADALTDLDIPEDYARVRIALSPRGG